MYDYGVLELGEDLDRDYGYLGIDARQENIEIKKEIEIYGYPGSKKKHLCHGQG